MSFDNVRAYHVRFHADEIYFKKELCLYGTGKTWNRWDMEQVGQTLWNRWDMEEVGQTLWKR